jgi:pimeloyl-ACP methyl ester carboxylesterase
MLDKVFAKNHTPNDVFSADYRPEQAVVGRKLVNEAGRNLYAIFPPWHGGGALYERLIQRLAKRGDTALAYYFHDEILRPNTDDVRASFTQIRDTVADELTAVTRRHDYEKIVLVGMSLGNAALTTVTGLFDGFDSVSLVVNGSSLASSMWHGIRTQHIRAGIEQSGHDLPDVEEAWSDLAPINHLNELVGKEVAYYSHLLI